MGAQRIVGKYLNVGINVQTNVANAIRISSMDYATRNVEELKYVVICAKKNVLRSALAVI